MSQEQEQLAMKSNMKRLEEENSRHLKTINSLKVQMKKHERMSGESRNKTVDLETELSQLKKVSGGHVECDCQNIHLASSLSRKEDNFAGF